MSEMVRLIDITGKAISGEWGNDDETGNGIPVLRTTNFTNDGSINYSSVVTRNIKKKYFADKYLQNGDIIIEKSGGSDKQPVGRVVYFDGEKNKYLFNNFTGLLRVIDKSVCYPKYLFYCLFNNYRKGGTLSFQNKTTGLHNLKTDDFVRSFTFPLPPLPEQRHIAAVLDKVSELIALRKRQLDLLDEMVKARFVEMFGDPVRNEKGFSMIALSDLGSLDRGRSKHRPRNDPKLLNGPYPLIQTGEVTSAGLYINEYHNTYSELGLQQSKMWKAGTLCITIAANIAQTSILSFDACFPDSVVGFIPSSDVTSLYIHFWFSFFQKILEEQAPQVAQKNINLKILSELMVMVPPIELQNQFADFVQQVDKSKAAVQQGLDRLNLLKSALMQEYFG